MRVDWLEKLGTALTTALCNNAVKTLSTKLLAITPQMAIESSDFSFIRLRGFAEMVVRLEADDLGLLGERL